MTLLLSLFLGCSALKKEDTANADVQSFQPTMPISKCVMCKLLIGFYR